MKWQKTQNKLVWLSRQSDEKSLDMCLLEKAISELSPETKQVFRLRRLKDESSLSLSYIFAIFKDMFEIASAKVVITDTYSIPVSCLNHKKDLTVIQLWHALGAVKKFSLQSVGKNQGRNSAISEALCMHKNYDYVIAPSQKAAEFYCEAFGCSADNIKIATLPRVDLLLDGVIKKEQFLNENPEFINQNIVLYLPTFRDDDLKITQNILKSFEGVEGVRLLLSAHPLSETAKILGSGFNGDYTTQDLMKIADEIITDYSACAFEAALLNKPLWFYIPDYSEYKFERGLNVDLKAEMEIACFEDSEELINAILKSDYNYSLLNSFKNKYVENQGTDNARLLAEFICSEIYNKKEL